MALGFREFLEEKLERGEVIRIEEEVDPYLEVGAVAWKLQSQGKPILFERIKGHPEWRIVSNIYGTRDLVAESLGVSKWDLVPLLRRAIEERKPYSFVEDAPFLENETRADLRSIPVPTYTRKDGGPYFTSAVVFAMDPEYGLNASFHRMMVFDKRKAAVRMLPRDLYTYWERSGKDLEVAVAVGLPIHVLLAAAVSAGTEVDEMEIANAISKTPMVKLENGIPVPAEAELVLMGRITEETHPEGPFVDLTGTYDVVREQQVIEFERMYYRSDPVFHALLPGGNEHKVLMGMPREPTIWREVEKEGIEVKGVYLTPGGCSWLHGVVAIKKKHEEDGKKAIRAALRGHKSMKHVIIVDDDINIYDPNEVEWAIATRFQASKDLMIFENVRGSSLDPSADPITRLTTKVGLDATAPLEGREKFERAKYEEWGG